MILNVICLCRNPTEFYEISASIKSNEFLYRLNNYNLLNADMHSGVVIRLLTVRHLYSSVFRQRKCTGPIGTGK